MNTLEEDRWLDVPANMIAQRTGALKLGAVAEAATAAGTSSSSDSSYYLEKSEEEIREGESNSLKMSRRGSRNRRCSFDGYGNPYGGNVRNSFVKILKTQAGRFSSRPRPGVPRHMINGKGKSVKYKSLFAQKMKLRRNDDSNPYWDLQNLSFDEKFTDCSDVSRYYTSSFEKDSLYMESIIESVAGALPGVMHIVGSYLLPREIVCLAMTSLTMCEGMRGCQIRLDWLKRSFLQTELEHYFGSKSRMTYWRITGAKIRSAKSDGLMWKILYIRDLKKLLLSDVWNSVDIKPLQKSKKLESFDAGTSCASVKNLPVLRNCDELKYVYIRNCNDVVDTEEFLPRTGRLRELSLYMCRNLRSLQALEVCQSLRVLDMGGCAALTSISALKQCKNLEQLSLADCASVETIEPLNGLEKLYHLDLTGCTSLTCFTTLNSMPVLSRVSLKRCESTGIFPLMRSSREVLSNEATSCLKVNSLWSLTPIIPDLVTMIESGDDSPMYSVNDDGDSSYKMRCNALEILAAVATQDTAGFSVLLQNGALPPVLNCIQNGHGKLREDATATLARMSHNRSSVPTIVDEGGIEVLVDLVSIDWDNASDAAKTDSEYKSLDMTNEYAASALLLIALIEEERERIVECNGIEALIKLLNEGTDGASVEAAGALWNLGATLDIGKNIVENGAVPALINTLRSRPLAAKIQAAGALRNLAILNVNKVKLCENGIIPVLIKMISSGELDCGDDEQRGLLVKIVATLRILSSNTGAQMEAAREGAIPHLVELLRKHDEQVRRQASGALLALSFNELNRNLIADAKGIVNLVRIVTADMSDATVMSAAGCLWNLAMNDDLERKIVDHDAIPALIRRLNSRSIEVVCKAAGALKNLSYQREHKEIVASHGGIPRLVELIKDTNSRVLPYAVGALRLVASGRPETRRKIVLAGAIPYLVKLLALKDQQNDSVRLASGTLLHLADCHTEEMVKAGAVPHLIAMTKWNEAPVLVREEAAYILQRIALSPNNPREAMRVERSAVSRRREADDIVFSRVRGVPGDTYIKENNTIMFYSYSSVACEKFFNKGKIYYEVEIVSVKGFPSFGWISKKFETGINHLYDCGVGFPGKDSTSHDSWAIDGVNQRKWPTKEAYGVRWKKGDVISICADLDAGTIVFGLNGCYDAPMGVAFKGIYDSRNESFALSPALSGSHNTVVKVNFGRDGFMYPPPESDYIGVYHAANDNIEKIGLPSNFI